MNLYKQLIEKYGKEHQMRIAQEELSELIQAISKYIRGQKIHNLAEEIVDVEIVLEQLKLMVSKPELAYWRNIKHENIKKLLEVDHE